MEKPVRIYLIWSERNDPKGTSRVRHFPSVDSMNDFLSALDETNVKSIKVVAGILLEEREEYSN